MEISSMISNLMLKSFSLIEFATSIDSSGIFPPNCETGSANAVCNVTPLMRNAAFPDGAHKS